MPTKRDREQRRARGLCIRCGTPSRHGTPRCERCLAKQRVYLRARYTDLRLAHQCVQCNRPQTRGARCADCKAYMKDVRDARRHE